MKTISFATSQMNLINCVEYLSTIEGNHTLVIDSASVARKNQMLQLLQNNAYSRHFTRIVCRTNKDNRFLDFFNTMSYVIKLLILSYRNKYDEVVSGNYLCFGSRFLYSALLKNNKDAVYVACDDGTGTVVVVKDRDNEIRSNKPMMYLPNRLLKSIVYRQPQLFIPEHVLFFTNYNLEAAYYDSVIRHEYQYLKKSLNSFNILSYSSFDQSVVVLGEPLYFKNFVTKECYAEKLKQFAKTTNGEILYYAHPEETREKWEQLGKLERYKYMDNFLPFEIVASILPNNCRVATFVSSVLMNIKIVNNKLNPECISFKREEILPQFNYRNVMNIYEQYRSIGVIFYEFD